MLASPVTVQDARRLRSNSITSQVGDALVRSGVIDALQLRAALAHREKFGGRLGRIVVEMRFAGEKAVVQVLALAFKLPKVDLESVWRDALALSKLTPKFCEEHAVFPVSLQDSGKTLVVAMAEPLNLELIDTIASVSRCRVKEVIAGEAEILSAVGRHYHNVMNVFATGPQLHPVLCGETELTFEEADLPTEPEAERAESQGSETRNDLAAQVEDLQQQLAAATRTLSALVEMARKKGLFTAEELRAASQA